MLNQLYSDDTSSIEEARDVLFSSQVEVYAFLKEIVRHLDEDEALAKLAEVDHLLTFPDNDFKFEYDVPNVGRSDTPYTLVLRYGDPALCFVKMTVNDLSQ